MTWNESCSSLLLRWLFRLKLVSLWPYYLRKLMSQCSISISSSSRLLYHIVLPPSLKRPPNVSSSLIFAKSGSLYSQIYLSKHCWLLRRGHHVTILNSWSHCCRRHNLCSPTLSEQSSAIIEIVSRCGKCFCPSPVVLTNFICTSPIIQRLRQISMWLMYWVTPYCNISRTIAINNPIPIESGMTLIFQKLLWIMMLRLWWCWLRC